jgi:TonB family protein
VLEFPWLPGISGAYKLADRELDRENNTVLLDDGPRVDKVAWLKNPGPEAQIMGQMAPPSHVKRVSLDVRSERFIRDRAIFKVIPVYHSSTGSSGQQADVRVRVVINEDGIVDDAECITGRTPLRELAEEAARQWKFEPVLVNGQPSSIESVLTFRFGR